MKFSVLLNKISKNNLDISFKSILILVGLLTILIAIPLTVNLTKEGVRLETQAAPVSNKITWQNQNWNVTGANVAWYNWGCDFGCNSGGGVSGNMATLRTGFQKMKDAGIHTARWWVFPGEPWQISRNSSGLPTGLNNAIYADFDAALVLAEEFDLYYNFVLFSSPEHPPRSWLDNSTHRTALATVLGPLFARYANNPRVMSWEIFNEPEFAIWGNIISQTSVVETGRAITNSVHANSNALVTVGHATIEGMGFWKDVPLDYYSPHFYEWMNFPAACARCKTAAQTRSDLGITDQKPIVIGEIWVGVHSDTLPKYNHFYDTGYAGVWGWTLFPERTNDQLAIDYNALASFMQGKTDIGPKTTTGGGTPKLGDLNNDNLVNIFDLSILLSRWMSTDDSADLNDSGRVDIFDLSILLSRWGL